MNPRLLETSNELIVVIVCVAFIVASVGFVFWCLCCFTEKKNGILGDDGLDVKTKLALKLRFDD